MGVAFPIREVQSLGILVMEITILQDKIPVTNRYAVAIGYRLVDVPVVEKCDV